MNYTTLSKRVDWSRIYSWDFSEFAELVAGELILAATVATVAGLTIGTPSIASGVITARISGGAVGSEYRVVCEVTTSSGSVLSIVGRLDVVE